MPVMLSVLLYGAESADADALKVQKYRKRMSAVQRSADPPVSQHQFTTVCLLKNDDNDGDDDDDNFIISSIDVYKRQACSF